MRISQCSVHAVIDNSSDKSAPRYLTAQTVQTAKNPGDSRRQHIYHRFGASEMVTCPMCV